MAKVTANYEAMLVINPALGEEAIAAIVERFKSLIETNGTLAEVDEWGARRLAYEIDHITEGYYVLINFSSAPDLPAELVRIANITEGVIRSLVVCKDE
ncbi:MAG: 30S ribosomal protein S6 [Oscillospiraceae bacterium]|nr:30S ribosomal protein S6 [Oscillospiraceae bacterium]